MEYYSGELPPEYEKKKEASSLLRMNSIPYESKDVKPAKVSVDNHKSTPSSSRKSNSESKSHSCYVCGKTLSSTSSYYVHMKQHSGHKPYHCPLCDVSFCRKPYLEVHMRTHTGERPFQCNVCLKRFTQKSSLNIHKRVHTGERPYSCDICDKKFAVKSYVDAHRWTHIFEKPLSCDKCQIPFNSKAQYILHMRSHSSALAYECPCGRSFTKDSYLIRHQVKVHQPQTVQSLHAVAENAINSLAYNHAFIPNDVLLKKNFDSGESSASDMSADVKKEERITPPIKPEIELNLASTVSSVIRNGIQSYISDPSNHLVKL
ncbi:hypothetical protein V9T40_002813 [Parthenolecanium corni]|uniref:C2H2-type domain-containing protein n=1 Tax=Parthenolecanium corni TaxID=536013 RepID=A0AAN9THE1_9HEMI